MYHLITNKFCNSCFNTYGKLFSLDFGPGLNILKQTVKRIFTLTNSKMYEIFTSCALIMLGQSKSAHNPTISVDNICRNICPFFE